MSRRIVMLASGMEAHHAAALDAIDNFDHIGTVIYTGRNLIKCIDTPTGSLCVKQYHRPAFLNRIVYTLLRKSKGLRAFGYPSLMARADIASPRPIAYVEERQCGLIARSWLVTEMSQLRHTMYEFGNDPMTDEASRRVIVDFGRFVAAMHRGGILHRDFSPGNILWDIAADGTTRFELVDVNRMTFGPVSVAQGCRNMARLWGQPAMFELLADSYSRERGASFSRCLSIIARARKKFWRRFSRRHRVKYLYHEIQIS